MIVTYCIWLGVFFGLLLIGGLISDYLFPRIPFINRWICNLPACVEEELRAESEDLHGNV